MRWLDSLKKKYQRWLRGASSDAKSLWAIIANVLLFPIRIIRAPFKRLTQDPKQPVSSDSAAAKRQVAQRQKRATGERLGRRFVQLISSPFRLIREWVRKTKRRNILLAVTIVLLICAVGIGAYWSVSNATERKKRFASEAEAAFKEGDFELAKSRYEQLNSIETLSLNQRLEWAIARGRIGESEEASKTIDELAPDNSVGLSAAHGFKALSLAQKLRTSKSATFEDPTILKKLRWHLEHAGSNSAEISQAWAVYHLNLGEIDQAIDFLRQSARKFPRDSMTLAEIYKRRGDKPAMTEALEAAETGFLEKLNQNPSNNRVRISLANVYVGLESLEKARQVLSDGNLLNPDPILDRALAEILAMQYDQARQENLDFDEQLKLLVAAIELESNEFRIYRRLMKLYSDAGENQEQQAKIRKLLEEIINGDQPRAFAYIALSEISWVDGDVDLAALRLEQAYKTDKRMVVIVNNLAWMLAHAEEPDLDRAEKLAKTAVELQPENPRFRDTYGTILMKLQRYKQAAVELNLALNGAPNQNEIHEKLVVVYENLGEPVQAQYHRDQIEQAAKSL